ncbi:MAG: PDDEXK nuclease domain-containing protein [Prevotella sp.]|nr:PDDEXK nuclease domain-containing protein [Prevotella sp.]
MNYRKLLTSIRTINEKILAGTSQAINIGLTLRNWLFGMYICEYEQNGMDRAEYGEHLLEQLSNLLRKFNIPRTEERELRRYRQFYLVYPQIRDAVSPEFKLLSAELIVQKAGAGHQLSSLPDTNSGPTESRIQNNGSLLVSKLSFTHFRELIAIDDSFKRLFYEVECMKGNWSVRELKRQITSLYYERSGLSKNKKKLSELANLKAELQEPNLIIRDPYVFEWFGIDSSEIMSESRLEGLLLKNIQKFLLEMGNGFCFEARQKRITIGDEQYFIDLVFYHRILKCHVLIELKLQEFTHENIGQLNTYVSWYKQNMMDSGDNPPIGILLCTRKNHSLVEYALAGMDNSLFVSKYMLELPSKKDMQKFIDQQMKEALEGEVS